MNKKFLFPLVLFSLALPGCTKTVKKLEAPVLSVNQDKTGLTWTEVADATGYELKVNNVELGSATSYSFDENVGNYSVSVRAVCADEKRASDYSTAFQYSTAEASITDISYADGKITWTGLAGAGVEVKLNNGEFATITTTDYTPTTLGFYTVRAKAGWSDSDNKFYVTSANAAKTIYLIPKATESFVIENGSASDNATLQEGYSIRKYEDTGWAASTASIVLNDTENVGATEGNCVQLNYWRHSAYFMFAKAFNIDESRDALEVKFKGDGISKAVIAFQVMNDYQISTLNLKGIYVKYEISLLQAKWQHAVIPFTDAGWKVNYGGNDMSFNDVKTVLEGYGFKINSLADLISVTDEFQIRLFAQNDENWSSTKIWLDDVQLINSNQTAVSLEEMVILRPNYTGVLANTFHDFAFENGELYTNGNKNGTYSLEGTLLTANLAGGATIVLKTEDLGETFSVESLNGVPEAYGTLKLIPVVYMIDTFNYSETGQGYDQSHTNPAAATGLRSHYYSDYYAGSGSSPIGGSNWSLMGSADYLDLATDTGHLDSKSAKFKFNPSSAMRMISADICLNQNAQPIGKGNTFSFWTKGGTKYNITLKVRVYYNSARLTPSTQQTDNTYVENIVVSKNADWTQVKIDLDPTKTYYGFSITTVANAGQSGADYFYLDDFSIYGSVDPWSLITD